MNLLRILALGLALILGAGAPGQGAAQTPQRTLVEGFGAVVRLPREASSIFVGDPGVADVRVVSADTLFLAGISAGTTNAFVLDFEDRLVTAFRIRVLPDDASARETIRALAPNAAISVAGGAGAAVLKGTANTLDGALAAVEARRVLEAQGRQVADRTRLHGGTQVSLKVRFVEASRSDLRELGVDLSAVGTIGDSTVRVLTGSGRAGRFFGRSAGIGGADVRAGLRSGDIDAVLTALDREGIVEILSEPTLTTTSGRRANFRAGGEFAIPVPQGDGALAAEYRSFGVSLEFLPTVLPGGRIALDVIPEVSFVDPSLETAVAVDGFRAPGLSVRRAETTVEVGSGQTFAIAGLYEQFSAADERGVPGLRRAPGLGRLFGTGRRERRERELVIFITPFLAEASDAAAARRPEAVRLVDTVGFIVK